MHTLAEVKKTLEDAVARKPDAKNPYSDLSGTCVYTGTDGTHCIAGQVLSDLGYEIPAYGNDENELAIEELLINYGLTGKFSETVINYLTKAQTAFDGGVGQQGNPPTWELALKVLNEVLDEEDDGE